MKPVIGIVGRTNKIKDNKYNIFVNDNHRRAVIESGGIPISILPTQNVKYEKINNAKENNPLMELFCKVVVIHTIMMNLLQDIV